jgi:deoxyribonuclease-4
MKNMRKIGIHIRLDGSLADATQKALRLGVDFFQCFLLLQNTNKLVAPTNDEVTRFHAIQKEHFPMLYVHGSYWINPAGIKRNGIQAFNRELALAKKLAFTHMILHSGSAKGAEHKEEGIDAVAAFLNKVLKKENDIRIILENTAHGNMSIGSDLHDFAALRKKLDHPEKIQYCLDTSHAYAYGYDIADEKGFDAFMQLVDATIGFENVALIHLNDTKRGCGSCIDQHEIPGQGRIGVAALTKVVNYPAFAHAPVLRELPVLTEDEEREIIEKIISWHG